MTKATDDKQKIIKEKLEYIGLNLARIPKFLKEFEPLQFRPSKSYDDTTYKVYKHVNVQDIEILVAPTDRLTDLRERYKLATPLFTYLDEKHEENIEKFATFLKMLTDLKIERIEELEEEQEKLKKNLPVQIKYKNHFVWQVYYSEYTGKYFMLVPTNEQDNSSMFYLLKKQIASKKSRKKETVFVPISHLDYSGALLSNSEIADIENYIWYFTKEWASVYEVYDVKNKMTIKIVGTTSVYEKIKSNYTITLSNKKEASEFYKLLKAMFILATGATSEYHFKAEMTEDGSLKFKHKEYFMTYKGLAEFIKQEYLEKIEEIKQELKEKEKLERRLKRFNAIVEELTEEYLAKQRQIATFLECKRTFFGRVKYFFKKKKEDSSIKKPEKLEPRNSQEKTKEIDGLDISKEQYTIEDLINVCTKLEEKRKQNTNTNLDIQAVEAKKDVLSKKIDNAELYIKEIDKHKKSIFEFWKFTSKDEMQTLNEGEEQEQSKREKIEKYFNYETELEDLGKIIDEVQRRKLSKNEMDGIFAAKQVIASMRELDNQKKKVDESVLKKDLEKIKEQYEDDLEYINMKDFDIFGNMSDDKTKIKILHNEKHREIEKDKYKVLNVNLETSLETYRDHLQYYLGLIHEAFHKIQVPYQMSIYKASDGQMQEPNGIDIYYINPENAIKQALNYKEDNIILYRINMQKNMPLIFYSNIMFFDNFNKTLPVGMDLGTEVLANLNVIKLEKVKEEEFHINYPINEFEEIHKTVKVCEYETSIM